MEKRENIENINVTLHVSVWVEMQKLCSLFSSVSGHAPRERVSWNLEQLYNDKHHAWSRSTWACELKYLRGLYVFLPKTSRSTWACELKSIRAFLEISRASVTLHVSVWVEIIKIGKKTLDEAGHAPRERVSWNFHKHLTMGLQSVTLHVSVWVEIRYTIYCMLIFWASRSTWACELKLYDIGQGITHKFVTLHVSVWVEMPKYT